MSLSAPSDETVKVGFATEGGWQATLDPELSTARLEELIGAGLDAIEFSVDASDEATYRLVRPGLEFDVLIQNVRMAVETRNRLGSDTRIIVSAINQEGVDVDMVQRFWSPLVDKVQIRKYLTWGYNEDKSADKTPYLPPEQRIPCPWLFERLNIDSRGDVTICGEDIAFREKFANIMERSIKDIWNGPEFTRFRDKHLAGRGEEIGICSACPDWAFRSWNYNYWKVLGDAEKTRDERSGPTQWNG